MADDTDDMKGTPKSATEERLLRQFLSTDGPKGNSRAYQLGHIYSFEFQQHHRDAIEKAVEAGADRNECIENMQRSLLNEERWWHYTLQNDPHQRKYIEKMPRSTVVEAFSKPTSSFK